MNDKFLNKRLKVIGHLIFWIISVALLSMIFSFYEGGIHFRIILKSLITNSGFAFAVYVNLYILIPRLLKRKSYIYYVFWLVLLLSASSLATQLLFIGPFHWLFKDIPQFMGFDTLLHSALFFSTLLYVLITSFLKFIKDWLEMQDLNLKMARLERQKFEAELKALKSQLNPHFLFNSLNNIYSLSIVNSPKVPPLILQLSNLMRYIIYEARDNFTPIEKEIAFVQNYIALQNLRIHANAQVEFITNGNPPKGSIAPLIFEPFIDNAYKHGLPNGDENDFITIQFLFSASKIRFMIQNNFEHTEKNRSTKYSGIGIENAKQRLSHLYAEDEYTLSIAVKDALFEVDLEINVH